MAQQRQQIREMRSHYDNLLSALSEEDQFSGDLLSPLALLLQMLSVHADRLLGLRGERFLEWLERTAPNEISDKAGMAQADERSRLADNLDELDSVLLTAIEELSIASEHRHADASIEALLRRVWQRSFSNAVATREAWFEQAFVRRGQGILNTLYSDADERWRLYQYGFSPYVGRRFERIAPRIRGVLEGAVDYGTSGAQNRLAVFAQLGELVAKDQGFGFRGRATVTDAALLHDWVRVLAWWMQGPGATSPKPENLRAWQRFVSDNFEFRLGVAVGAVVAQAWSAGASDPVSVPSLGDWKQTTGLPWFGFWARELLRWGTLDPFVAFTLAQGLADTRDKAADRRHEFESWMKAEYEDINGEDWIDPQYFLKWERSLRVSVEAPLALRRRRAQLTGTDGRRGTYSVHPISRSTGVHWIDASGFEMAVTAVEEVSRRVCRDDFELQMDEGRWQVRRVFRST